MTCPARLVSFVTPSRVTSASRTGLPVLLLTTRKVTWAVPAGEGGTAIAATVTDAEPLTEPLVALIMVVPLDNAVNFPVPLTVPTVALLLDHVTVAFIGLPY